MGLGVAAMHYTGMQAMQMSPAINYDPSLFAASIVIAVTASFAALKLAFHLRGNAFGVAILSKIGSAVLMGIDRKSVVRERVCQYVSISGVAVSLKQKHRNRRNVKKYKSTDNRHKVIESERYCKIRCQAIK